ncbi:MAG: biopolymer transporter ExbD [Proteobacteria bacterium]|nr:biopolymer transporter ExbD [Pseudomonadota bacterium]
MKLRLDIDRKARIEMLPLIDIVFLLLVFFIYAMLSMAVHRGLPINLPVSSTAEVDKNLLLSISIDSAGAVSVDKTPIPVEELGSYLKQKMTGQEKPGVLLFADNRLPYQQLFSVLDQIKLAGIERVSMQAEKEN